MVSNTCLQTKGCDHPWLTTLCHVAFQKYCTNWCQYENAAFSKASPDFDFVIIMYFYQLCWHCIILCFKFPRLLGRLHRFARICFLVWIIMHSDFLDHESSRNNIALTDVVPFPRDSACSFFFFLSFLFFNHNFSPKSLWLKKVLLDRHRSHSGRRSSIQLRFPAPYLLVAAHSNPLINFPEGSLLF